MSSAAANVKTARLAWFARHELRLAWREWLAMMTGGRRRRTRAALIGLIVFAAVMHLPAWAVIGRFATLQAPLDKSSLIVLRCTARPTGACWLGKNFRAGDKMPHASP